MNALRIGGDLAFESATLTEPLACILRALDRFGAARPRYGLDADSESIGLIVIAGGGPAGQLFLQVLRRKLGYEGTIILSDGTEMKREIARRHGAVPVGTGPEEILEAILEHSKGRRAEMVIDACGAGSIWSEVPVWIRKQAGVLMYGYGRRGASMERLNDLQWREPTVVTPAGASGGFDPDGRPSIYRRLSMA